MSNEIKVYPLTTKVKFGENFDLKGEITAITLRESVIMYEITCWKVDELKSIWLKDTYFKTIKTVKQQGIGFDNEIS
jgi:hypothetical protein